MNKEEIKQAVLEFIQNKGRVTYVEIEEFLHKHEYEYDGRFALSTNKNPKVYLWMGWNKEMCDIMIELKNERLIHEEGIPFEAYLLQGKVLTLPIAKS